MLNNFQVKNTYSGIIVNYNRNKEFCGGIFHDDSEWQRLMDDKFNKLSENKIYEGINKNDFLSIYAENSNNYISKELIKYINNIKDLNGNKIDFNSLNAIQQSLIISFLKEPLEQTKIYGTKVKLSDINIDLDNDKMYLEANLNTIDGNILSYGAEFSQQQMNKEKYNYGFLEHQDSKIYKFSFTSNEKLNTNERKKLIENIRNADENILNNFKENVNVAILLSDENSIENGFAEFSFYSNSNLELHIQKATENIKNTAREENKENNETSNFILLNIYWDKLRKNFENFETILKDTQNDYFLKNTNKLLSSLLSSDIKNK